MLSSPPTPTNSLNIHHNLNSGDLSATAITPQAGTISLNSHPHPHHRTHHHHHHRHSHHPIRPHHHHHHHNHQLNGNQDQETMSPSASQHPPNIGNTPPMDMIVVNTITGNSDTDTDVVADDIVAAAAGSTSSSPESPGTSTLLVMATTTNNIGGSSSSNSTISCSSSTAASIQAAASSSSSSSSSSSISVTTIAITKAGGETAVTNHQHHNNNNPILSSTVTSNNNNNNNNNNHHHQNTKECLCVGCQMPIRDRFLMYVNERYWHESCLQCTVCRINLTNSCYVKERKIYCKNDYNKLYAAKCTNCMDSIQSNELVMRVHGYIYHLNCFHCFGCKRQLKKGDKFALRGHQPLCETDLVKENHNHLNHNHNHNPYQIDPITVTLMNRPPTSHHHHNNHHLHHPHPHPDLTTYDLINGLGHHSPSIDVHTSIQTPQLTMLQPASGQQPTCQQDVNDSHQYSPRTLTSTICDITGHSPLMNSNSNNKNDPPPPPPSSTQPYASPPLTVVTNNNANNNNNNNNNNNCNNGTNNHNDNINSTPPVVPMKQDGRRGPKRPRTILTTAQRRQFKQSFEVSQKPCRKVRETLAKETGLSVRIVQVWFQNQRAKLKKIQRKQQQQQMSQGGGMMIGNGSESGGGMGSSDKSKDDTTDEEDEDDESQQFSLPYMIPSPDAGSFYSGRGEEDGYTVKSEMGCMDDSETSLCELDDSGIRSNSEHGSDHHRLSSSTPVNCTNNSIPFGTLLMQQHSSQLTMMSNSGGSPLGVPQGTLGMISSSSSSSAPSTGTPCSMFSPPPPPPPSILPNTTQHYHPQQNNCSINPTNNSVLHPANINQNPVVNNMPNMTPIDKLYSMQNSYFNNPSECEC